MLGYASIFIEFNCELCKGGKSPTDILCDKSVTFRRFSELLQ